MSNLPDPIADALIELERVVARCRYAPQAQTEELRETMRALSRLGGPQWPFHDFWDGLTRPDKFARCATVESSLNGIYRSAGRERELSVMTAVGMEESRKMEGRKWFELQPPDENGHVFICSTEGEPVAWCHNLGPVADAAEIMCEWLASIDYDECGNGGFIGSNLIPIRTMPIGKK